MHVSVPLPPINPKIMSVTATSLTLMWTPSPKSEVSGYSVEWTTRNETKHTNIRNPQLQINGMLAGQKYTINIYSRNIANERSLTSTSIDGHTRELDI